MKKNKFKLTNPEIRLETTNRCNASCIMCPREKMTRPMGVLDMELFKRVVDEAVEAGATTVSLDHYGEPLMDPHFIERVKYAKKKGLLTFTVTNASLLNKELSEKLILAGFDKLRISMYGMTKEVFEKIHKGLDFDTVIGNIHSLLKARKALDRKNPRIEMCFLVLEENKDQVGLFRKEWEGVADDISIWKPHNWSDGRAFRKPDPKKKKTCGRPDTGPLQMQWDGIVIPCCFDYNSKIILGDLKKQSLAEVMRDPRYEALRDAHRKAEFWKYPLCDICDQLEEREDVLIYTTVKNSRVGATNTAHFNLLK